MNNATQNPRPRCTERAWCDKLGSHDTHTGEADLPKITATGYREDFHQGEDTGVVVPEVIAILEEHEHSDTLDRYIVHLVIARPDGENAQCYLTMKESELLAKALGQLVAEPAADRSAGLS